MKRVVCLLLVFMISACASVRQKNSLLMHYSSIGDSVRVEEMIRKGANVNSQDSYRDTPLHWAVFGGQLVVAELLLERGAKINAIGAFGNTPLHASMYRDYQEISRFLIEKGADSTRLNSFGLYPREMEKVLAVEEKVYNTAVLLNTNGSWNDREEGRIWYNRLLELNEDVVVNALVLQVIRNEPMRLPVLILAIKLGINGSEEKLANLLMIYGDKSMAEDYLNCGSNLLDDAARRWARKHGYDVNIGRGSHRARWGRF